ncbi:MAG: hypothetical protein QOJ25_3369 [Solirubrobacteraceae bacterium]|jgi:hypothetical protein|nr:hypothetical protein [Solirubrobacteraceae bacterium]
MAVTLLSVVVGAVLFVILTVTVAAWWVAAVAGLGVILLASLFETVVLVNRDSKARGPGRAYS